MTALSFELERDVHSELLRAKRVLPQHALTLLDPAEELPVMVYTSHHSGE